MSVFLFLNFVSSISFLFFGANCLKSEYMRDEFARYGLPQHRKLVGILQLAGAVGLLIGLALPFIGLLAAFGLGLLMLLGLHVRLKIRDGWMRSSPALAYLLLNAYLCTEFSRHLMTV